MAARAFKKNILKIHLRLTTCLLSIGMGPGAFTMMMERGMNVIARGKTADEGNTTLRSLWFRRELWVGNVFAESDIKIQILKR